MASVLCWLLLTEKTCEHVIWNGICFMLLTEKTHKHAAWKGIHSLCWTPLSSSQKTHQHVAWNGIHSLCWTSYHHHLKRHINMWHEMETTVYPEHLIIIISKDTSTCGMKWHPQFLLNILSSSSQKTHQHVACNGHHSLSWTSYHHHLKRHINMWHERATTVYAEHLIIIISKDTWTCGMKWQPRFMLNIDWKDIASGKTWYPSFMLNIDWRHMNMSHKMESTFLLSEKNTRMQGMKCPLQFLAE